MTSPVYFSLKTFEHLLKHKLHEYADAFLLMQQNNGRFPYPDSVLEYFDELGVEHWAEIYLPETLQKLSIIAKEQNAAYKDWVISHIGESATVEEAQNFLKSFFTKFTESLPNIEELKFLNETPDPEALKDKSDQEKAKQKEVLITFLVGFYNDLSIATHGESIFNLIDKATEHNDDQSLAKAIQIDPTIIKYFERRIRRQSMQGNSDFFDTLSYRLKNPPSRGVIKHPLLWILFKDLLTLRCLHNQTTNREILDFYNDAVSEFPEFIIEDEQILQRQRRKFLQKYRLQK